ncbi:MAG: hypothetical protein OXQ29_11850 [Rhodospirillaceae bacterium]|nr:hypothetical protein [Rhodospirillaceae bacterium]
MPVRSVAVIALLVGLQGDVVGDFSVTVNQGLSARRENSVAGPRFS